jgi:hypothetical protein
MKTTIVIAGAVVCLAIGEIGVRAQDAAKAGEWTDPFTTEEGEILTTGRNLYFVLEPGYRLEYAGKEVGQEVGLIITVLEETKTVDGVEVRVVEERETKGDKVIEVPRNYFAISKRTNDVFYFGEDVDIYRDDKVVSHEGSWLSGVEGAKFGLVMPGRALLGARYYQERAPGKARDRAEIVGLSGTMETPAGKFSDVIEIEETTPLEPDEKARKSYAPGVGKLTDGPLKLIGYGPVKK